MAIRETILQAIDVLGLASRVTELSAPDAAQAVAAAEKKFVAKYRSTQVRGGNGAPLPSGSEFHPPFVWSGTKPGVRWWWESLDERLPVAQRRPESDGYRLIETICPAGPAWLFASDDELPPWPVYLGTPPDLARLIGECHCFEYIVVSPSLEWLVIENHHDLIIAVGEPVVARLAAITG